MSGGHGIPQLFFGVRRLGGCQERAAIVTGENNNVCQYRAHLPIIRLHNIADITQ